MEHVYQLIGTLAAAFAGGLVGGRRAFREIRDAIAWLTECVQLIARHIGVQLPKHGGNGKAVELGLTDHSIPIRVKRDREEHF